ncbi:hypothetical protein GCM10009801_71690 [Streptomyces albiaxialis]|uniref:DUF397 domain-containing protein n=1 Tax=Streptomyces albiaxialis TaxID=329523 RepID=A0ABP5IJD1_9ACTN
MSKVRWVKSSFSEDGGNNCVEVAATAAGRVALRESESPAHVLTVDRAALSALIRHVKADTSPAGPAA